MNYILHIAASLKIGGAEKVAAMIGEMQDPSKYQNHYIVFGNEIGAYEDDLIKQGCKIFHINPPSNNYRNFLNTLKKIMQAYPYRAVHAHTMFNAGWAMHMSKKMKVPVRISHSHSALDINGGMKTNIYEKIMRYMILTCSTDLIACGEKAGIRLFGEKEYRKRAHLILNGIDTKQFKFNTESRLKIRQKHNLEERYVIGHTGHLATVKNQKYLIELMPEILKVKPSAKLLLLGEGEDRKMLEDTIKRLELEDHVIMTGNVMNVSDYLSAMDVFAFPSLYEGMPLSIIEVQANGLPCVLSTGVPKDVYLTDLIHPVSLEEKGKWMELICQCERKNPEKYAGAMKESGFDVSVAMRKIYDIYERKHD